MEVPASDNKQNIFWNDTMGVNAPLSPDLHHHSNGVMVDLSVPNTHESLKMVHLEKIIGTRLCSHFFKIIYFVVIKFVKSLFDKAR